MLHGPNPHRLRSDAAALIAGTAISSLFGAGFWWLAARAVGDASVGRASAVIAVASIAALAGSAGTDVSGLSEIPRTTDPIERGRLMAAILLVVGVCSAIATAAAWWFVDMSNGTSTIAAVALMSGAVFVTSAGFLFDTVATALGRARWTVARAVVQSVSKLAVLGLSILMFGTQWWTLVAIWNVVGIVSILTLSARFWRREASLPPLRRPDRSDVMRILRPAHHHFGSTALGQLPMMAVPVIVVHRAGPAAGAHTYIGWMLAGVAFTVSSAAGRVALASAAAHPDRLHDTTRSAVKFSMIAGAIIAVAIAAFSPLVLRSFGTDFENAVPMVRWMLLAIPADALTNLWVAKWRSMSRLRATTAVNLVMTGTILAGVWLFVPRFGIAAVGVAWLVGQTVGCIFVWFADRTRVPARTTGADVRIISPATPQHQVTRFTKTA